MAKKAKGGAAMKSPPKTREQRNAEKQALAMWALLGEGGSAFGGQLKPEIEKAEREALLSLGLVTVRSGNGHIGWKSPIGDGTGPNSISPTRCPTRHLAAPSFARLAHPAAGLHASA